MCSAADLGDDAAEALEREAVLITRLQQGDADAFETLVRTFGPRLLTVARRYLPAEDDAQDALQDAFVSAFRGLAKFSGNSRLGTWLHRIVVNAALMKLRTRRRHAEQPIDAFLPQFVEDGHYARPVNSWSETAETVVRRGEMVSLVRREIEALPESHRVVLLLRDIDQLDTEETAKLLNISPNAVKTRLHRARLALRERLDAHFGGSAA